MALAKKTGKGKIQVAVLGATGMVGQRFISLLDRHPWFEVVCVAASPKSAGKRYAEATKGRWMMQSEIPKAVSGLIVLDVESDKKKIAGLCDMAFSAIEMDKKDIARIEEEYAALGVAIVSNNSAHRWTPDVPMIMPEVNADHCALIDTQRKNRGWGRGLIAVKPNCSLQSYIPLIKALESLDPRRVIVTTLQAISGAGKTFENWPEMLDNVIPLINGEEEKTEQEPLRVLGSVDKKGLRRKEGLMISATCTRVAVSDGHMASVFVEFSKKADEKKIISLIEGYKNPLEGMSLPSAPEKFIHYFSDPSRPQTRLDRDLEKGMAISVGRIRADPVLGWKFVSLSHNTVRGAAGGAILVAELLVARGYITKK